MYDFAAGLSVIRKKQNDTAVAVLVLPFWHLLKDEFGAVQNRLQLTEFSQDK